MQSPKKAAVGICYFFFCYKGTFVRDVVDKKGLYPFSNTILLRRQQGESVTSLLFELFFKGAVARDVVHKKGLYPSSNSNILNWPGTVALHIFPLLAIVLDNRNLAMPGTSLTNSPLLPTLNQLYLVIQGAGYHCTALLLYLQTCRVTATGISFFVTLQVQ
jgi:hypothetical protein